MNPERKGLVRIWLFCAILLPVTVSLGFWQLDRAAQKQAIQATQARLATQSARSFDYTGAAVTEKEVPQNFQPLKVEGRYRPEVFLLDNRIRDGRVGYEVLNMFESRAGGLMLVNRGWIAAPRLRNQFPKIAIPEGSVSIEGFFYKPDGAIPVYGENNLDHLQAEWPKRIQGLDWAAISNLVADEKLLTREFRLKSTSVTGALRPDWRISEMSPEKHLGYAVQWFGLSLALLVLTLLYSLRYRARGGDG